MKQIIEISDDPNQSFDVVTEDNQVFQLQLNYSDQQQGWFYSIVFEDFTLNSSRLVTSFNILRPYSNILPFGIGIATEDGSEPIFIDDFSTGRVSFFLLTETEVQEVEERVYGG